MHGDDFAFGKLLYEEVSQLDVLCFLMYLLSLLLILLHCCLCFKCFLDEVADVEALLRCRTDHVQL